MQQLCEFEVLSNRPENQCKCHKGNPLIESSFEDTFFTKKSFTSIDLRKNLVLNSLNFGSAKCSQHYYQTSCQCCHEEGCLVLL